MRKIAVAALAILTLAAFDTPLHVYTSKEGRFTVKVPAEPQIQHATEQTAVGPIDQTMVIVDGGKYAFMVGFADMPAAAAKNADVDKVLDGARDGAAARVHGTITTSRPIRLAGHAGRDFIIAGNGVTTAMRVYLVGARLYQVLVAYAPGSIAEGDIKTLLDSFKLAR